MTNEASSQLTSYFVKETPLKCRLCAVFVVLGPMITIVSTTNVITVPIVTC